MENKYYTPNIEDLHVGYECELQVMKNIFEPIVIGKNFSIPRFVNYYSASIDILIKELQTGKIRTPYLTKEQIETEEWVYQDDDGQGWNFIKNKLYLYWHPYSKHIKIGYSNVGLFYGTCNSINEFRTIIKLLSI